MNKFIYRDLFLVGCVVFVAVYFAIVAASHTVTLPIDLSIEALPVEGGVIDRLDVM